MSLVKKEHWEMWMGSMPMPEDCTFEQMFHMHDAIQAIEDREYAADQIAWYESLWRYYKPRYDLAVTHKDGHPDYAKEYETYGSIMKLIKKGILFWREELTK